MSAGALLTVNGLVLAAALAVATVGVDAGAAPTAAAPSSTSVVAGAPVQPAPVQPVPVVPPPAEPETPGPSPAVSPEPELPTPRTVTTTGYAPYATVGPVVLHAPGDVVEAIGFHQSGNDAALPQSPVDGPVRAGLLEQRGRDTHPAGAADIVVDPAREVRAPVTGTVLRGGDYTLYCDHVDQYVVIEPTARPGWEVKLLHFGGLQVARGDRVEAGVTVVGSGARVLPFRSQVDDHTAVPHWPHLHLEVVDPSLPDRPSGRGC
jgi:biotin carboxyl carrier protein